MSVRTLRPTTLPARLRLLGALTATAGLAFVVTAAPAQAAVTNCSVTAPPGFAICLTQSSPSNPVLNVSTNAFHAVGTPYQFGAYNASIAKWQGGPWLRHSTGFTGVTKLAAWNWSGTVRHQIDNQGTNTALYEAAFDKP